VKISSNRKPSFERLLDVLWNEEPDLIPFYEHFVDDEVVEAITGNPITNIPPTERIWNKEYLKTLVEFYYKLGYDYVPLEVPLKLPRVNILQAADTATLSRGKRSWQNENKGTIETREDFESYPWPDPEEAADLSCFESLASLLPENMKIVGGVAGGIFEYVSWMMGLAPLSRALYLDKNLVSDMFNRIGSLIFKTDEEIAKLDCIGALRMGDDLGYKKATFIAPKLIKKYVLPWHKRCVEIAHKKGMPFILHSCGNLYAPYDGGRSLMDDLIHYVKIDAKHSFEDAIMPVWDVKAKYGDKVAILGGVDVDKLARLPETQLRTHVRKVIEKCASGGGYALGSGNTVTNYMKPENYLVMLDEGRKIGRYR